MSNPQHILKAIKHERQLKLELEGISEGIERFRKEMLEAKQKGNFNDTKVGTVVIYQLLTPFCTELKAWMTPAPKSAREKSTKGILSQSTVEKLGFITLKTLIASLHEHEIPLTKVCTSIGKHVIDDINLENFKATKNTDGNTWTQYVSSVIRQKDKQGSNRSRTMSVLKLTMNENEFVGIEASTDDLVSIGASLLNLFIKATGLVTTPLVVGGKTDKERVVAPTSAFMSYINKLEGECELLNPVIYPMIVPPKNHGMNTYGGFLSGAPSLRVPLVKDHKGINKKYLRDWEMPQVYEAINIIQNTAWRINKDVLEVLSELIRRGSEVAELDLPSMTELVLPVRPWGQLEDAEWEMYKANNHEVVKRWKSEARDVHNKNISDKSKRILYKSLLSVANKMKDEEELYYCYNLDWRGRVYPIQSGGCPNPQGIDASKALLQFAHGESLGDRGAYWLSVQGANTFGDDKLPMDDRGIWASLHEADIVAVAEDPFTNKWWWEADEPWKFLAFCFDWNGYVKSGYSKNYESRTAVALDGSCSGIQHFSALLRDRRGALATNVINGIEDKPSDIYGEVAKVVSEWVEEDARNGRLEAILLRGKITRSVCKRNTMTTPYGVSQRGMIDQLMLELDRNEFSSELVSYYDVCKYLAEKNYNAIGEVVVASRKAMDWLKDVTKVMAKADKVFMWTVPSGFKIRQAYWMNKTKRVETFWGGTRIRLSINEETPKLNHKKVTAGQAPNYIHGMDASHLMLTVNKGAYMGVFSFALVHDSFGTHAGKTEALNVAIRETFIEQYKEDNLAKFRDEIAEQLPEELRQEMPMLPSKGDLELESVRGAKYFFS